MRFDVVTLFPQALEAAFGIGVLGRAVTAGRITVRYWNPRDYTRDVHRTVDDRPYGGGPGMVMTIGPLRAAIDAAREASPAARVLLLSPQGRRFDQAAAARLAATGAAIVVCARYEGVDERLVQGSIDEEWSIGDYVLSGGEPAAWVLVDGIARLVPGVLGHADSANEDSFATGLLDHPHYTRADEGASPAPAVLASGDHERVRRWRLGAALARTWERRPDLLARARLDHEQRELLREYIAARSTGGDKTG